jgi:hypothetical protein
MTDTKVEVPEPSPAPKQAKAPEMVKVVRLWGGPRKGVMLVRAVDRKPKQFRLIPVTEIPEDAGREFEVEASVFAASKVPPFARSTK